MKNLETAPNILQKSRDQSHSEHRNFERSQKPPVMLSKLAAEMLNKQKEEYARALKEQSHLKKPEKYLVLDLDETLVHSTSYPPDYPATQLEIYIQGDINVYYMAPRSGLIEFLESMKPIYNIIIYTTALKEYAEAVIETLRLESYVTQLYTRGHCQRLHHNRFIKEMNRIGIPLKDTVFIDDCEVQIGRNHENGLKIKPFLGQTEDNELKSLVPLLQSLVGLEDVRPVSQKSQDFFMKTISRRSNTMAVIESKTSSSRIDFVTKMKHFQSTQISKKIVLEEEEPVEEESPRRSVLCLASRKVSAHSTAYQSSITHDTSISFVNNSVLHYQNYFSGDVDRAKQKAKVDKYRKMSNQKTLAANISGDILTHEDDEGIDMIPVPVSITKRTKRSESFGFNTFMRSVTQTKSKGGF